MYIIKTTMNLIIVKEIEKESIDQEINKYYMDKRDVIKTSR